MLRLIAAVIFSPAVLSLAMRPAVKSSDASRIEGDEFGGRICMQNRNSVRLAAAAINDGYILETEVRDGDTEA